MAASSSSGFSLVQTSLVLAVAGVVLAATLPGSGGEDIKRQEITLERMKRIEEAAQNFMATNYRRPCPALGSVALDADAFGTEQGAPGVCAGAHFTSGNVVAGTVPVRDLGLPDSFALDGYGRRFTYVVDRNATSSSNCYYVQKNDVRGSINVRPSAAGGTIIDQVMWALISYGKDGHGAYPANGSAVDARINTFTTDDNHFMNAFVDESFEVNFNGDITRARIDGALNDTVWYNEPTKNACCIGNVCTQGVRMITDAASLEAFFGTSFVIGNFNDDEYEDLAYSNHTGGRVHIIFGRETGWPVGTAGIDASTWADTTIVNDAGVNGFGIFMAAGNVDGKGPDDILVQASGNSYLLVGLNEEGEGDVELTDLISDEKAIRIITSGSANPGDVAIGDVDGDGLGDLIISPDITGWLVGVVYGQTEFKTSTYNLVTGSYEDLMLLYSGGIRTWATFVDSLDLDADGFDDIVVGGILDFGGGGSTTVLYGKARSSWPTVNPPWIDIDAGTPAYYANGTTGSYFVSLLAGETSSGQGIISADINNDANEDLLIGASRSIYQVAGGVKYPGVNILGSSGKFFRIDTFTNRPAQAACLNAWITNIEPADVNGDSYLDLIISCSSNHVSNGVTAGAAYVLYHPTKATGWPSDGFATNSPLTLFTPSAAGIGTYGNLDGTKGFVIEGAAGDYISKTGFVDMNLDGLKDIIIGSPNNDGGDGAIYVIYGRENTPWQTGKDSTWPDLPKIDLNDFNP
jgi:hypothetical protein